MNRPAPISLRRNVLAAYASQTYSIAIGIVVVPFYLKIMGTEAYGLIGLFTVLQTIVASFDVGITPTMAREAARLKAGATTPIQLRRLLRSFESIFVAVGIAVVSGMILCAGQLSTNWLKAGQIGTSEVRLSLVLMAAIAWLRWYTGLYRGVINGFERQTWQAAVSIIIATAHSLAVIPFLVLVGSTPSFFFLYQLAISVVELAVVSSKVYRLVPSAPQGASIWFQYRSIASVFRFSAIVAVTSSLWLTVTQADKILLSALLPLSQFGIFSLATVVAGGINSLSTPLSTALMPRLTDLKARSDSYRFALVYTRATQLTAVLGFTAAAFLAIFARQVLAVWTGNPEIASGAALTLALYSLGNGFLAFGAFPYYLQYANGDMRLHLIGSILFAALLVPSVVALGSRFGAAGAGTAWLAVNFIFLVGWTAYVHRKLLGAFQARWLVVDIASIAVPTSLVGMLVRATVTWPDSRLGSALLLALTGGVMLATAAAASSYFRGFGVDYLKRLRNL